MENLQGGTITLEHRYDVHDRSRKIDHVTLYEGQQEPFEQPITIKVFELPTKAHVRDALLARHFEAAYQTSRLRHEALLRTIDHGELERGVPFIITERVEGHSLHDELERQGTLSPRETATLIERLAHALEYLHGQGLAHGSISAHWITLPTRGGVAAAVLDHAMFGLTLEDILEMDEGQLPKQALQTLAPELFRHELGQPDASSDIWALGALAYTCLVGVHPYFQDVSEPFEAISRIKAQPPRQLKELGVDPQVSQIIDRALSPEPISRWPDAISFARALNEAITPSPALHAEAHEPAARAPQREPAPPQAAAAPSRAGTIAGLALLLLFVTNLAWCGYAMSTSSTHSPTRGAPQALKPRPPAP